MSENLIPDRALLRLNVRTFEDQVRARVLATIRRALEASASGAPKPPGLSDLSEYLLTRNDGAATRKVVAELERSFGTDRMRDIELATAGEDNSLFSATWAVPAAFWASAVSARRNSRRPNRWASSTRFRPITCRTSHR